MKQAAAAVALVAFALPALAQPRIQKPGTRTRTAVSNTEDDETEVDVATLAVDIGHYDHKRVRTSGILEILGTRGAATPGGIEYYELRSRHTNSTLLFIPGSGLLRDDLRQVLGNELQVRGVGPHASGWRRERLRRTEPRAAAVTGTVARPAARVHHRSVALDVEQAARIDGRTGFREAGAREPGAVRGQDRQHPGPVPRPQPVRDLKEETRRKPTDWVLKDGEVALWITEKPPKGSGFTLDPEYKSDTERWVEVEGKPEVVDGVLYLRASKVTLASRRAPK
jgi:hypothetical protein